MTSPSTGPTAGPTPSPTLRPYQEHFYNLNPEVGNETTRLRRAAKIAYLLEQHSGRVTSRPLRELVCLDLGCSSGVITCALSSMFKQVIGVDYDDIALNHIPADCQAVPNVSFARGDAMRLALADASVDVIICAQVYEHVPSDVQLVAEMDRVLKPDGFIFFSGPNKLYPIEPHYFLPFLHWLPNSWADAWLRRLKRGDHYYERSRTWWSLRHLFSRFAVQDVTWDVLVQHARRDAQIANVTSPPNAPSNPKFVPKMPKAAWAQRWIATAPQPMRQLVVPLLPNFNWLLTKRAYVQS